MPAFFHFQAQEAKRLRALREVSKGSACKRCRGRACVTESSPGHQVLKKVGICRPFPFSGPGSKAPARFAGGLERQRLQALPGSRLCDRVLSWAPGFKKVGICRPFPFSGPGSKAPARFAGGLERQRLQALPGSRLCDRVLSWAPGFKKVGKCLPFSIFRPRKQSACALCGRSRKAALASAAGVAPV